MHTVEDQCVDACTSLCADDDTIQKPEGQICANGQVRQNLQADGRSHFWQQVLIDITHVDIDILAVLVTCNAQEIWNQVWRHRSCLINWAGVIPETLLIKISETHLQLLPLGGGQAAHLRHPSTGYKLLGSSAATSADGVIYKASAEDVEYMVTPALNEASTVCCKL